MEPWRIRKNVVMLSVSRISQPIAGAARRSSASLPVAGTKSFHFQRVPGRKPPAPARDEFRCVFVRSCDALASRFRFARSLECPSEKRERLLRNAPEEFPRQAEKTG